MGESADRQAAISARTQSVAGQLDATVAEFRENGLGGGEDVRTLTAVRDVLGRLSAGQMRAVTELLRRPDAAGAYAGQQDIVVQLRAVLARYQRQQAAADLAGRLAALGDRQAANLRATVEQRARGGGQGGQGGGRPSSGRPCTGRKRSRRNCGRRWRRRWST